MISLIQLLREITTKPKAIILAGGASVGKSTLIKSISPLLSNFENLNADKYVEDKNSPLYGNLSASSNQIIKNDLPNAIKNKSNFIYDTTASKLSTITPILSSLENNGYDVMMIMVYAHPMVSFLRNFKRERKVPAVGVLSTWINTYNLIEDYKKIFGDNFILVSPSNMSTEEQNEIKNFQMYLDKGQLSKYFEDLLSTNQYKSTFKKDIELSPEDTLKREKQREKTKEILNLTISKISDTFEDIQSNLTPVDMNTVSSKIKNFIK